MTDPSTPPLGAGQHLPSGTVTFLFTDIEGSTKLSQQYREAMPALLARHNQILHQAIEAHNGYVFQVVGDSFAVAFHSAGDALHAALDAQRALHNENWSPAPIKVRMGIHTGTAKLNDASAPTIYSGYATLASTQRVMSAGHGGQILLSGATRELVRHFLPENTELKDLGEKRLEDLLGPEHLYQLNISGLPTTFPPLKTLDSFANNLPTQLTSFIGRENEIAEVKQELEGHRLVTLTGSGGTGKTRLSLQVAADLLDHFDHGVWFIELAPLTDPELIPQTILSGIGISEQPNKAPLEIMKEYLHEKKVLIVLDNCEHLISASAQVVNTLLNAALGLRILASSREALGVKGEASYPVPSLSLPDIKHLPLIDQLSQYEAVRLFIDRTLLVAPHFVVDQANAPFITQICYRLDGIPLAIELAAARVKVMSVEQISKRLDDRFRLLTGGARTSLPRHQTLRALIDWSHDLLSEKERLHLYRLSVFAGGWTLEAVEEVCSGAGIETYDVLDLLTQLINKSLVIVIEHSQSGETRYRMLETIRQYAREKLLEVGSGEGVRDKHLAYFVKLAEHAEPELYRFNQVFWLNKLDDELDNLRTALEWALSTNIESGLQISAFLWLFWKERRYHLEIGEWLSQLLEHYNIANSLHVRSLITYCNCMTDLGLARSRIIADQSLEMARMLFDEQAEAYSLLNLGAVVSLQGNVREGIPLIEQSLTLFQALGDKFGQANAAGLLSANNNDLELSKAYILESLRLYRELGHLSGIADCLLELASRTIWGGEFSYPSQWLKEARTIFRQLGNQAGETWVLVHSGALAFWQGNYQQACIYYQESLALAEKIGYGMASHWSRVRMAYARLQQDSLQDAKELFELSAQGFQKVGLIIGLVYAIEGLASLHAHQERFERAAQLFAWADAMREKIGDHRPPVEQASVERDLAVIHSKLNEAEYAELCAQGQAMTVEEAVTLALED